MATGMYAETLNAVAPVYAHVSILQLLYIKQVIPACRSYATEYARQSRRKKWVT
jgi:hypothetical protein